MTASALIIALAFVCVYFIVERTVYSNLDKELGHQARIHTHEVTLENGNIRFVNKLEWEEREHREAEVNPVFLQLMDLQGKVMDKSPNLKKNQLAFQNPVYQTDHFSTILNGKHVRQYQMPVSVNGTPAGYIVVALSQEPSLMLVDNLRWTLFILYPLILIIVFIASSVLAGRSIAPVRQIIDKTNSITRTSLSERISLPANEDELHALTTAINGMLERIQNAMVREEQFTADASHELRTPITILKGTLEVLLRRDRTPEEYRQKIAESLEHIERMSVTVNNLLELARIEHVGSIKEEPHAQLSEILQELAKTFAATWPDRKLELIIGSDEETFCKEVPFFHATLIFRNLIENALKYSFENGQIKVLIVGDDQGCSVWIEDQGRGISEDELQRIRQPFYRSEEHAVQRIKGSGLGLSIAEKAANAIGAHIRFEPNEPQGTRVIVQF